MDWVVLATLLATSCVLLGTIIHTIGRILNIERLAFLGKIVAIESVINLVIIGAVISIISFFTALSLDIIQGTELSAMGADPFSIATSYLNGLIDKAKLMEDLIVIYNMILGLIQSVILRFSIIIVSISVMPCNGLSVHTSINSTLLNILNLIVLDIYTLKTALKFCEASMMQIFFPVGIVLRAFPLSKKLGSTFIAIAIGFYIVFPLLIDMNVYLHSNQEDLLEQANTKLEGFKNEYDITESFQSDDPVVWENAIRSIIKIIPGGSFVDLATEIHFAIAHAIADLIFWFFILTGVALILTITFVRELSRFIGGDIGIGAPSTFTVL